jgi:dTDP-4-amino-4,6-dideoxygalactose transaminase
LKNVGGIQFRRIIDEEGDACNNIILLLPDKEKTQKFIQALNAENINCSCLYNGNPVYMNPPIFHQKSVDRDGYPFNALNDKDVVHYFKGMCPRAEELLPRNVSIYLSPGYSMNDAEDIAAGVKKVAQWIL